MKKLLWLALLLGCLSYLTISFVACAPQPTTNEQFTFTLKTSYEGESYYEITNTKVKPVALTIPSEYNGLPVRSIGSSALISGILETLTIPSSVQYIATDAFDYCSNLKEIYYQGTIDQLAQLRSSGLWAASKNVYVNGKSIDANVRLTSATYVADSAFKNCLQLTEITIPSNVEIIGRNAFDGCVNLRKVTIEKGVQQIDGYAFNNCTSLETITIPSTTNVVMSPFNNCTALTEIIFEEGTRFLLSIASNCPSLTKVSVPNSVIACPDPMLGSIEVLFYGCDNIRYYEYEGFLYLGNDDNHYVALIKARDTSQTSCKINEKTQAIYPGAFQDCTELQEVYLPNGVTKISSKTFVKCKNLKSIIIPKSIESISSNAFSDALEKVYYAGNAEDWNLIDISDSVLTSVAVYYYSEVKPTTDGNYWHYGTNGNVVEW